VDHLVGLKLFPEQNRSSQRVFVCSVAVAAPDGHDPAAGGDDVHDAPPWTRNRAPVQARGD